MAIITKPAGGVLKGVPATFTLNKAELLSVSAVSSDAYFSNSSNWNRVHLIYKSSQGKQYEVVEFNATLSSPTGTFSVSEKARDAFEIQTLEILDFDGGIFVVPRSSLTVADFDIDFNAAPSEDLWAFYGSPDTVVDEYKVLFNGATGLGVRRQAFSKLIPNSKTGAEFYFNPSYAFNYCIGLIGMNENPTSFSVGQNLSDFFYDPSRQFVIWFASNGSGATIYKNTTVVASIGDSISTSDKIGCFVDPIAKTVQFTKNGTNIGSPVSFADQPSYAQLRFSGYRGDSIGEVGLSSTISYPLATYENIASNLAGNPIMWDLFLNGATTEADGGLIGASTAAYSFTKSNASKIANGADFTITYKFTNLVADWVHGISSVLTEESQSQFNFTGLTYQQNALISYYRGVQQPNQSLSILNSPGENTLVIEKTGTNLTFTLNNTVVLSKTDYTEQLTVPAVRPWNVRALDSAYIE